MRTPFYHEDNHYGFFAKCPTSFYNQPDKTSYPAIVFYQAIEHAYAQEAVTGNGVNAALHVWGYFKGMASTKEKERFFNLLQLCQKSGSSMVSLKRFLFKLADKYKQEYLLNSYYFI